MLKEQFKGSSLKNCELCNTTTINSYPKLLKLVKSNENYPKFKENIDQILIKINNEFKTLNKPEDGDVLDTNLHLIQTKLCESKMKTKKYLFTENQIKILKKYILEQKFRSYVFDWDDNVLMMPTKIKMDKLVKGKWIPEDVSTEEFADVRHLIGKTYRLRNNNPTDAFEDFRDDKMFINDVEDSIHQEYFGPSFDKFKEALLYGNHFAINTARGHSPNTLKKGVKLFIDMIFTNDEINTMISNLKNVLPDNLLKGLNNTQIIDLYLDEMGEYYPVSSDEFMDKFGIDSSASNPEQSKKIAIEDFAKKVASSLKDKINDYEKFSVGFSDDDPKNLKAAEDFIKDELSHMFPELNFIVYDTSKGGKQKIVIKKTSKDIDENVHYMNNKVLLGDIVNVGSKQKGEVIGKTNDGYYKIEIFQDSNGEIKGEKPIILLTKDKFTLNENRLITELNINKNNIYQFSSKGEKILQF